MRVVIIPAARPINCPECQSEIPWRRVRARLIVCPRCGSHVQLRGGYFRALYLLAVLICLTSAYAIGIHDDIWLLLTLALIIPTFYVLLFVTLRLFPPELEPSDDFRAVLYGPETAATEAEEAADTASAAPDEAAGHERLDTIRVAFRDIARPAGSWSLEGVVIAGGAIVIALFLIYSMLLPLVYGVFPEFDATRTGPSGFPFTLHIGEQSLRVDDHSPEPWKCVAELGGVDRRTATFEVQGGGSTSVDYSTFSPAGTAREMRSAARSQVVLTCVEPSGISHTF